MKIISSFFSEEVKPILLVLFGKVNLLLKQQSFSSNRQSFMDMGEHLILPMIG